MTDKVNQVLLSLIRDVDFKSFAEEICNVQPMMNPFRESEWPFRLDMIGKFNETSSMREWCKETLAKDDWISNAQYFAFKTEEAYSWFKLRWL